MPHIHSVFILIEFLKSLLELHDTEDMDITILRNVGVSLPVEKA
jgi:hypothetical protein